MWTWAYSGTALLGSLVLSENGDNESAILLLLVWLVIMMTMEIVRRNRKDGQDSKISQESKGKEKVEGVGKTAVNINKGNSWDLEHSIHVLIYKIKDSDIAKPASEMISLMGKLKNIESGGKEYFNSNNESIKSASLDITDKIDSFYMPELEKLLRLYLRIESMEIGINGVDSKVNLKQDIITSFHTLDRGLHEMLNNILYAIQSSLSVNHEVLKQVLELDSGVKF